MANTIKQAPVSALSSLNQGRSTSDLRVLIIHTEWNKTIIDNLLKSALLTLKSLGLQPKNILTQSVPGSYELPWACNSVLSNNVLHTEVDAIIAMGVLIKGDTMHFEYIAESVSKNLSDVSIKHNKPIIFGVLTCLTETQALIRSGLQPADPSNHNHAVDWARAAVECAISAERIRDHTIMGSPPPPFMTAEDHPLLV